MPRWTRWLLLALIAALLLAGFAVWRMHRHADAVLARNAEAARATLEAFAAGSTPRPPLSAWPPDRPEAERIGDARLVYEHVLGAVMALDEKEMEVLPEQSLFDLDAIDEEAVRAYFVRHQDVLDGLAEARYADHVTQDPRLTAGMQGPGYHVGDALRLALLLRAYMRNAIAMGDDERALHGVRLRLLWGHDLGLTGGILQALMGAGAQEEALNQLRLLLARDRLPTGALVETASDLQVLATGKARPRLEGLLTASEALMRKYLVDAAEGGPEVRAGLHMAEAGWRDLFSFRLCAAAILEDMEATASPTKGLDERSWMEAAEQLSRPRPPPCTPGEVLRQMDQALYGRVAGRLALSATHLHVARTAVALARYRRDHGTWPTGLEALVPAYLEGMEPCPLSGLPLGQAGGRVWAGGGDGDDDGGRALDADAPWDADGDRVWDLEDATVPDPFEGLR